MTLTDLLAGLNHDVLRGAVAGVEVSGLAFDSRRVQPGFVFVAVPGTRVDGHDYISVAGAAGAGVIVGLSDRLPGDLPAETVYIAVDNPAEALAELAANWYGHPSREMQLIGVTGTNGKTTVTTLLHDLFTRLGYRAGLLSTVEVRIGTDVQPATHTTPDAPAVQARLADMRDAGCDYVFMEVSSHAVDQRRTHGLDFNGGVFTNLSRDHLDYHPTFADYLAAKKCFFDELPAHAFALTNLDDKRGTVMLQNTPARRLTYSLRRMADYRARLLTDSAEGLQLAIEGTEVFTQMIGRYNGYNLLAAYAVARQLGQEKDEVLIELSRLRGAAGRLEPVATPDGRLTALVDYAHTPDALENVLTTLRASLREGQRLLCVVGAGGDRDRGKRPQMAATAARLADQVILTSDNPRSEDPETILDDMEAGLTEAAARARTLRITDRRNAIKTAVRLAGPTDVLLVAGKGHETYQEINGQRLPFDDRVELARALNDRQHVS